MTTKEEEQEYLEENYSVIREHALSATFDLTPDYDYMGEFEWLSEEEILKEIRCHRCEECTFIVRSEEWDECDGICVGCKECLDEEMQYGYEDDN